MACSDPDGIDYDAIIAKMKTFSLTSGCKNPNEFNTKANGKFVLDSLQKYKAQDIRNICDASVFPACKVPGKPHMELSRDSVKKYINTAAWEVAKRKTKDPKLSRTATQVEDVKKEMADAITGTSGPKVKHTAQSKTGNVDGMTDTKNYTGAHKNRFDESGKGKGVDGRVDLVENKGYVGNYKGEGSYGKK